MTGVAVEADFDAAVHALGRLTSEQLHDLAFDIAGLIEDQTKLRIADEKAGPDGNSWPTWSTAYAATRKENHSLLVGQANPGLMDSVQNYTTGLEAVVGTNLIYGATHQFGSEDGTIPARTYLGLSAANRQDIEDLVVGRIEELLQ